MTEYLILASSFNRWAGPNNHLLDLCNYLYEKLSIDFKLMTHEADFCSDFIESARFPILPVLKGSSSDPWTRLTMASINTLIVRRTIQSLGISKENVFVNASADTLFEANCATQNRVNVGYNVFSGEKNSLSHLLTHLLARLAVRRILAHTNFHKKFYMKIGINEEKISIVPHCIDTDRIMRFLRGNKKEKPFDGKKQEETKSVIFYGGRLSIDKGVKELISCYESICETFPVTLMIVGEGPLQGWVALRKKAIERRHRNASIVLLPWQTPSILLNHMANASVVVIPSYVECFGLIILEAMLLKRPVVATRFGGSSEIITDHRDGILVDPHNKDELRRCIEELLENENLRRKIGDDAFMTVREKYDVSKVAPQFCDFLKGSLE